MGSQNSHLKVLAIYIEPAPYIVDLIRVLRQRHPEISLRVLYLHAALTQPWEVGFDDGVSELLPASSKEASKVLLRAIRAGDFDILHLAGWGHPLLMEALIMGGCFGRIISVESDTQLPEREPFWKAIVKRLLYPLLFSRIAMFFPGGSRQQRYFRHYGVPERKIRMAQMTVDVTSILQRTSNARQNVEAVKAQWGLPLEDVIFLYIGRLDNFKGGVQDLLKAFEAIAVRNNGATLVIAGDGELRASVEAAVAHNEKIRYLGRLPYDKVLGLYPVGDVLILPSHFDNWGLVVNEAMAAGLPVIASDRVGCVDDLVQHGSTGLIFPSGDRAALEKAMQRLAGDKLLRKQMGEAGRTLISQWRLEDEAEIMTNAWQEQITP